jgi:hypothetical protein
MKGFLCALLIFLFGTLKAQTNLYVDSSVVSSGAGTSWNTAYRTINEALNVANTASSGAKFTINVAKGTYYPAGLTTAPWSDSCFLIAHDGVKLLGGYPGGGGSRNSLMNPVILSGEIGSVTDSNDNSCHIMVIAGITSQDTVVVDGFTMRGGVGGSYLGRYFNSVAVPRNQGAGLHISGNFNTICIVDCRFEHNSCAGYQSGGAGVFATSKVTMGGGKPALVSFSGCTFEDNFASRGGGAFLTYEASIYQVRSCRFTRNRATIGAGLHTESLAHAYSAPCALDVSNSTFTQNTASFNGGGFYNDIGSAWEEYSSAAITISGCSFSGNSAVGAGGGVYCATNGSRHVIKYDSCTFDRNTAESGGGIHLQFGMLGRHGVNSQFNLTRSSFRNNSASAYGGGISLYNFSHALIVGGSIIENNTAPNGGGISLAYSVGMAFDSCLIRNNTAQNGGGLYSFFTSSGLPIVTRCSISGNSAINAGGGLYHAYQGTFTIDNSVISGNYAGRFGGALFDSSCNSALRNCTLSGDSAGTAPGIYNTGGASPIIMNSIIWEGNTSIVDGIGSTPTVVYNTIQGGYPGTGNISTDPQFLNPQPAQAAPTINGNYQVFACSPTIDAGTATVYFLPGTTDKLGRPRKNGAEIDQGAYEYYVSSIAGPGRLCAGEVFQLPLPAYSIGGGQWRSQNTSVATVSNSGLVSGISAGTTRIDYVLSNSVGCADSASIAVTVDTMDIGVTQNGPVLTANQVGAKYQWINCDSGNAPVAGGTGQVFTAPSNGQYAVVVTFGSCMDTSGCFTVASLSVPDTKRSQSIVQLFPNPTSGVINIKSTGSISIIVLYDAVGRQLKTLAPNTLETRLDLSSYPSGVYLMEFILDQHRQMERISLVQ